MACCVKASRIAAFTSTDPLIGTITSPKLAIFESFSQLLPGTSQARIEQEVIATDFEQAHTDRVAVRARIARLVALFRFQSLKLVASQMAVIRLQIGGTLECS